MTHVLCHSCAQDDALREIIKRRGARLKCSICHRRASAFSLEALAELIATIVIDNFHHGREIRIFGDDDRDWYEPQGESLSLIVQNILGQDLDFIEDLVDQMIEGEDCWPPDGDEPFFDSTALYEENRPMFGHYYDQWRDVIREIKYEQRFFSQSAQNFFEHIFAGIEILQYWDSSARELKGVVYELPAGTRLFRARVCNSDFDDIQKDPFKHIGPPPSDVARASRMNPEGVVVLYAAIDQDTCLAEMRPALGGQSALITLQVTRPLRLLNFKYLEEARGGNLSYFQSDFKEQVEKTAFLKHIHRLISQPVIPGKESDYIITQSMAEYLAYVHQPPMDGVVYSSVQQQGGMNLVLFRRLGMEGFPVAYVDESLKLFTTTAIRYSHQEVSDMNYGTGDHEEDF